MSNLTAGDIFSFFIALEGQDIAFLIMASLVGLTLAIIISNRDESTRSIAMIVFAFASFVAAYKADIIFDGLDITLYGDYNLNLSAEFLSAFVIIALFSIWDGTRNLVFVYVLLVFIIGIAFIMIQFDGNYGNLFQQNPEFAGIFTTAVGIELLSAVLIFFIFLKLKWFANTFSPMYQRSIALDCTVISIGLGAMFFTLTLAIWEGSPMRITVDINDDLTTGIIGAIMTSVILCSWVTARTWLFPLICITAVIAITALLINEAIIGRDVSLNFSAELLGALIATILTERGWLWNERRYKREINLAV